ncbi:MAG: methyltransferase domain-containing protein [bacterium]|nr:methyltransferase domain-containing protein [bacterium]
MATRTLALTDNIYDYLLDNSLREPDVLKRLRVVTDSLPNAQMQISPEQGQFMALLVQLLGARRTLEIGTFTGYSALVVALALPPEGKVVACDISEEWTDIARRYWEEAGVADRIDLHLGPALDTLDELLAAGEENSYDFVFIDADKTGYDSYYERSLRLLRPGGLITIDNVLRGGRVADINETDEAEVVIRELNAKIHRDERVSISLVPIGDGLTLAMKRVYL